MSQEQKNEFDAFAANYDEALHRGVSLSGENKEFFAQNRIRWLQRTLKVSTAGFRIMDFGCGTGTSCPYLLDMLGASDVVGVDVSAASIEQARQQFVHPNIRFTTQANYDLGAGVDLVFCNGVFHHIPLDERDGAIRFISTCLKPGGFFVLWENNPWNPGTHWVMARIPFDRDAKKVFPHEAVRLVSAQGLRVASVTYAFVFPKFLAALRGTEPYLSRIPLGAQYQVISTK